MSDQLTIIVKTDNFLIDARKEIGEYAGIKFMVDPNLPDDEIRILEDDKIVSKIKIR